MKDRLLHPEAGLQRWRGAVRDAVTRPQGEASLVL